MEEELFRNKIYVSNPTSISIGNNTWFGLDTKLVGRVKALIEENEDKERNEREQHLQLMQIIKHYGIDKQLKYIHSEYFELDEAILNYEHEETLYIGEGYGTDYHLERTKNHIAEEIADVMVMLKQFQYYYGIDDKDIETIMKQKIERQLKRIEQEVVENK